MAHITGHIRIATPIEQVFDTVANSRHEPSFNPAMTGVELLTPPPIGLGTRFRAHMGRAGMEMLVELTEFDRPRRLGIAHDELDHGDDRDADLRHRGRGHGHELGLAGSP